MKKFSILDKKTEDKKNDKVLSVTIIIAILLLSSFLGFYKLNSESLWEDELSTIGEAKIDSKIILGGLISEHPPLYVLFIKMWMKFFGNSEFSVRAPSAIFGIFSVGLIYILAKKAYDERTGLISALLLCTSQFFIRYQQEARAYSALLFFSILSTVIFLYLIEKHSPALSLGYSVVGALGINFHYFMGFVLIGHFAYGLTRFSQFRNSFYHYLAALIGIGISFSYWLFIVLLPRLLVPLNEGNLTWIKKPDFSSVVSVFGEFIGNWGLGYFITGSILILLLGLFLILFVGLKKERFSAIQKEAYILSFLYLLPLLIFAISQLRPVWAPRFLIILFPALVMLITRLILEARARYFWIPLLIFLLVINSLSIISMYTEVEKTQIREAAHFVLEGYTKGDHIITYQFSPFAIAYYAPIIPYSDIFWVLGIKPGEGIYNEKLIQSVNNAKDVFVVYIDYKQTGNKFVVESLEKELIGIDERFELNQTRQFDGARVEHYIRGIGNQLNLSVNESIQISPKRFLGKSIIQNESIVFKKGNDDAITTFISLPGGYETVFEMSGTAPPPIKISINANGKIHNVVINQNIQNWQKVKINSTQVNNSIKLRLGFTFYEDAYKRLENGTIEYDRNVFVRNITIKRVS